MLNVNALQHHAAMMENFSRKTHRNFGLIGAKCDESIVETLLESNADQVEMNVVALFRSVEYCFPTETSDHFSFHFDNLERLLC